MCGYFSITLLFAAYIAASPSVTIAVNLFGSIFSMT